MEGKESHEKFSNGDLKEFAQVFANLGKLNKRE